MDKLNELNDAIYNYNVKALEANDPTYPFIMAMLVTPGDEAYAEFRERFMVDPSNLLSQGEGTSDDESNDEVIDDAGA